MGQSLAGLGLGFEVRQALVVGHFGFPLHSSGTACVE